MAHLLKRIFENDNKVLKRYGKIADKIEALSGTMEALSDEELKAKTEEFKNRYAKGESLDDMLVEALLR